MRRLTGFVLAAVLAATSCFAAPAKIATQEWVKQALAGIGVRVSTATVATNVTTSATTGAVVTNLTFTSPYTCAEVPQCRAISFTVSTAKTAYRQAMTPKTRSLLNLLFASVYADGEIDTTVYLTIESGYWTDAAGNIHLFLFDTGWTCELQEDVLPDPPTTPHTCEEFDSDCVCKRAASPNFAGDAEYRQYDDVDVQSSKYRCRRSSCGHEWCSRSLPASKRKQCPHNRPPNLPAYRQIHGLHAQSPASGCAPPSACRHTSSRAMAHQIP